MTSLSGRCVQAEWFTQLLMSEGFMPVPGAKWDLAQYNPPWTLPFLRTNEIHVPIASGPEGIKV